MRVGGVPSGDALQILQSTAGVLKVPHHYEGSALLIARGHRQVTSDLTAHEQVHHARTLVQCPIQQVGIGQVACRVRLHAGQVEGCGRFQPGLAAQGCEVRIVHLLRILQGHAAVVRNADQLVGHACFQDRSGSTRQQGISIGPSPAQAHAIVISEAPRIALVRQLLAGLGETDELGPSSFHLGQPFQECVVGEEVLFVQPEGRRVGTIEDGADRFLGNIRADHFFPFSEVEPVPHLQQFLIVRSVKAVRGEIERVERACLGQFGLKKPEAVVLAPKTGATTVQRFVYQRTGNGEEKNGEALHGWAGMAMAVSTAMITGMSISSSCGAKRSPFGIIAGRSVPKDP